MLYCHANDHENCLKWDLCQHNLSFPLRVCSPRKRFIQSDNTISHYSTPHTAHDLILNCALFSHAVGNCLLWRLVTCPYQMSFRTANQWNCMPSHPIILKLMKDSYSLSLNLTSSILRTVVDKDTRTRLTSPNFSTSISFQSISQIIRLVEYCHSLL